MSENLSSRILERLKEPFGKILSRENFGVIANDIAEIIYSGQLSTNSLRDVLKDHKINDIEKIKPVILDMLLFYINLILEDNYITSEEAENVNFLKRLFKIKEGDFYHYKYKEVEAILDRQLEYMYQDNKIDTEEALQKVELQELFNLSYDQFLKISQKAVSAALDRGADPSGLDTFINAF